MSFDSAASIMTREQGLGPRKLHQFLADARLVSVDVKRNATEPIPLKRVSQRVLVHQRATGHIHEPRAGLEPPQTLGIDELTSTRGRAEHDAVGAADQRLERHAEPGVQPLLDRAALALHVVVGDFHAEGGGAAVRDLLADVPEAHETEHVPAQVVRQRRRLLVGCLEGRGRCRRRDAVR